jgi:hypothetical protein
MNKLYGVESLFKFFFLASYWVAPSYCILIGVAACFMAVYRRLKAVEFSWAYLERFLQNEYGTNIIFILSFSSIYLSLFFYVTLSLHFLTALA